MRVKMIDATEAPGAKPSVNRMRDQVTDIVRNLEAGKVAQITPDKDQSLRGLKSSFTRAGAREGVKLRVWDAEGRVYAGLIEDVN